MLWATLSIQHPSVVESVVLPELGAPGPLVASQSISPGSEGGAVPAHHLDASHRVLSTWSRHVKPVILHSSEPLGTPMLIPGPPGTLQDRWIWRVTLKWNVSKSPICSIPQGLRYKKLYCLCLKSLSESYKHPAINSKQPTKSADPKMT